MKNFSFPLECENFFFAPDAKARLSHSSNIPSLKGTYEKQPKEEKTCGQECVTL
jgi:hypothetical protein